MFGSLARWFGTLPTLAKILVIVVALGLSVRTSPMVVVVAFVLLLLSILAVLIQVPRGGELRNWGLTALAPLFVLGALYGCGAPQQPENQQPPEQESAGRQSPSQAPNEEPSPEASSASGAQEAAPTPEPQGQPEPEPAQDAGDASRESAPPSPQERLAELGKVVTLVRAVDGDTIEVSPAVGGRTEVRLIGIDTPEFASECGTQPLAQAAENYTATYTGHKVALEFDVEKVDPYDRALSYVYLPNGSMLNELLVRSGYAQVATYPPNTRYEDRFLRAQEAASASARGIWGLSYQEQLLLAEQGNAGIGGGCTAQPEPTATPTAIPTPTSSPTATASPAPDPSPSPERPAPAPGGQAAPAPAAPPVGGGDKDCADFSSLAQVQQSIRGGDPYGLDADGDGEACESDF